MTLHRRIRWGLAVGVIILFLPHSLHCETHLDADGWTRWLTPSEVAPVVEEFASTRLANDIEARATTDRAEFRIQWTKVDGGGFDIRLLNDSKQMDTLKRERLNSDLLFVKAVEAKESGGIWQLALWHRGATPGWSPHLRALCIKTNALVADAKFQIAVPTAKKMVDLARTEDGETHAVTRYAWQLLAIVYAGCGDFEKALDAAATACAIAAPQELDTPNALWCDEKRANFLLALSRFSEARTIYQRLLDHWQRQSDDAGCLQAANTLSRLATIAGEEDEFSLAEAMLLEAIETTEKLHPTGSANLATFRHNLANLHSKIGDLDGAEAELIKVKTLDEQSGRSDTIDATHTLRALGQIRVARGDARGARRYFRKCLAIAEKLEKPPGLEVAISLNELSNLESGTKSEALLNQSLAIYRRMFTGPYEEVAISTSSLGRLAIDRSNLKLGIQRLSEALTVVDHLYDKTSYRRSHLIHWISLANFGLGNLDQARDQAREELRLEYLHWQRLASVATERQRQAARETLQPFDLPATLNDGELLAVATLLLKGVVLDADLRDRRFAAAAMQNEKLSAKWGRLEKVRERLRNRELTEALGIENTTEALADKQELDKLDRDFREAASLPGTPTLSPGDVIPKVQAVLPENAVLVEFVRYRKWLKASKHEERYAAAVISKTAEPKYVDFGSARILDDLINRFRQLAGTALAETATKEQIENADREIRSVSRALYHKVVEPIQAASPTGTQEVIICPDSQLHFLSFYVLMAPNDQFWGDRVRLRFVSTGRDLLLPEAELGPSTSKNAVLFGQPAYDMPTYGITRADPSRAALSENTSQPENYELAGTGVEVDDLQDEFASFGWNCRAICSWDASEAALHRVHRPNILHLATHGFFLPEIPANAPPSTGVALERVRNPMQRSGLLLAGASSTLRQWREHKRPDEDSDGILTAGEVAGLDLQGTALVTLSACKTALGEAPSGEGVLGLKRAFLIAGARRLVITLWSISDRDTRGIMKEFYGNLLSGAKPVDALGAAQSSALAHLLSERGLQHAINRAGSFVFIGR